MRKLNSHNHIYDSFYPICPAQKDEKEIDRKMKVLQNWEILKDSGIETAKIEKILQISKSSYYRYKKSLKSNGLDGLKNASTKPKNLRKSNIDQSIIDLVLEIRLKNPTYGKFKIAIILTRDYEVKLSESSVGRVIGQLKDEGKIATSISAPQKQRKPRKFKSHAQRWQYGMKSQSAGELVQVDHMTVTKNGVSIKHFQAWDPISKIIIADVKSSATSASSAKFLQKLVLEMPFQIKSIQVDGGSEFMKDFENTCEDLDIKLYVLPPRRPQFNGGVERGNRIFREEFYAQDIQTKSIAGFRYELQKAVAKYNNYRPHFSLKGMTPMEYNKTLLEVA